MLTLDFERLPHRQTGATLLDIGCGAGRHSFEALRRGFSVISADVDAAVLKDVSGMAAAMLAEGQIGPPASSHCVNASALELPFTSAAFDVVIASEVLEHIVDDEQAIAELRRVTKPGGTIVVTVPRRWPERICWGLSREYHAAAGGHVRIYRRRDLEEKLARHGLHLRATHHAHALHVPYWWLKCAFGVANGDARVPAAYHRFLVWDIKTAHPAVRRLEKLLNPIMGKSLVLYAEKQRA